MADCNIITGLPHWRSQIKKFKKKLALANLELKQENSQPIPNLSIIARLKKNINNYTEEIAIINQIITGLTQSIYRLEQCATNLVCKICQKAPCLCITTPLATLMQTSTNLTTQLNNINTQITNLDTDMTQSSNYNSYSTMIILQKQRAILEAKIAPLQAKILALSLIITNIQNSFYCTSPLNPTN